MDELLKIEDIAKILNVREATVKSYVYHKQIPFLKIGGNLRFDLKEIHKWLDTKSVVVAPTRKTATTGKVRGGR